MSQIVILSPGPDYNPRPIRSELGTRRQDVLTPIWEDRAFCANLFRRLALTGSSASNWVAIAS